MQPGCKPSTEISLDLALDPGFRAGAVKPISEGCGYLGIIESLMQLLVGWN
jgi:hypothetical protein